ncbi:biopolymer transporter ExbD [Azovibrio restrictus]|uniref:ExbD/TolR family protein n=1 Tax=Azovibrio restrictus TaxID=146938 RepID=UPI0026E9F47B|nr:biopolymer transporter ExbD [Azovibrio restrictus]MDD3483200.1 biopolymer transporter ExbD [Azovibrio restrictus]
MAFGSFDSGSSSPMVEINTTPLVDVMLVLLIIFLVTAPLMTQAVKVDLPQASAQAADTKPETIRLAIDAQGVLYWNETPFTDTSIQGLESRLQAAVSADAQLEVQLSADRDTRYQRVAEIMAAAKRAGVTKLGFVTQPGEAQ